MSCHLRAHTAGQQTTPVQVAPSKTLYEFDADQALDASPQGVMGIHKVINTTFDTVETITDGYSTLYSVESFVQLMKLAVSRPDQYTMDIPGMYTSKIKVSGSYLSKDPEKASPGVIALFCGDWAYYKKNKQAPTLEFDTGNYQEIRQLSTSQPKTIRNKKPTTTPKKKKSKREGSEDEDSGSDTLTIEEDVQEEEGSKSTPPRRGRKRKKTTNKRTRRRQSRGRESSGSDTESTGSGSTERSSRARPRRRSGSTGSRSSRGSSTSGRSSSSSTAGSTASSSRSSSRSTTTRKRKKRATTRGRRKRSTKTPKKPKRRRAHSKARKPTKTKGEYY